MPPKILVKKEDIVDATIELIRSQGPKALSARKIAAQLGCSSQPIYRVFKSMEELSIEVYQQLKKRERAYAIQFWEKDNTLMSLLEGFLSHAIREPNLRSFTEQMEEDKWDLVHKKYPVGIREMMEYLKADPILESLPEENIENIILNLIIYLHGLAGLGGNKTSVSDNLNFNEETQQFFKVRMKKAVEMFVLIEKNDLNLL